MVSKTVRKTGNLQKRDWMSAIVPCSHGLIVGFSDFEASDIEACCLPYNILLTPCAPDQAGESAGRGSIDVVVLNLSDLNYRGIQQADRLRYSGVSVLCLVTLVELIDAERLSHLPADDFMFQPYRSEELICRLEVLLAKRRRALSAHLIEKRCGERRRSAHDRAGVGEGRVKKSLIIDQRKKCVFLNGEEIVLTPREHRLLSLLAEEPGRVFSSEEVVDAVWSCKKRAGAADVQQYIHRLRKKLEPDPHNPLWIVTVPGFGYRLELPAQA